MHGGIKLIIFYLGGVSINIAHKVCAKQILITSTMGSTAYDVVKLAVATEAIE